MWDDRLRRCRSGQQRGRVTRTPLLSGHGVLPQPRPRSRDGCWSFQQSHGNAAVARMIEASLWRRRPGARADRRRGPTCRGRADRRAAGPATQRTWTARSASTCGSTTSPTPRGSSTASTRPTSTAGSRATRSSSATGSTTPPTATEARPSGSGRRSTSAWAIEARNWAAAACVLDAYPEIATRVPVNCGGWDGGRTCTCWRPAIRPTWRSRGRCAPSSANVRPTSPPPCRRRWAPRAGQAPRPSLDR